jgi:hypothetical protein
MTIIQERYFAQKFADAPVIRLGLVGCYVGFMDVIIGTNKKNSPAMGGVLY